jgi:tetratricopeptide (TPR) repeat protein
VSIACASLPVSVAPPDQVLDAIDARVLQGCYECLLDARGRYDALRSGRARSLVTRRLFAVELLLALRERELALDSSATLGRAAALVPELPPELWAERYVAAVESVPHDRNGWPRSELAHFRQTRAMPASRAADEVAWVRDGPLTGPIAEYLATALECSYGIKPPGSREIGVARPAEGDRPPPLIRYRRAICVAPERAALEALRADVPSFAETSLFLGQIAVATIAEGGGADPHLLVGEALERFPESPAVTYLAALLQQAVGDWNRALVHYDQTIGLKPRHEDAWLGRTVSLTELGRPDQAIDAATRMIDLALDNSDVGLYWRAWNRHVRGALADARADIDALRRRRVSEDILTLAGAIEHDQDDLVEAERDLLAGRRLGRGRNCRAEWYLGSVFVKKRVWGEAATTFEAAMTCYDADVASRQRLLDATEANTTLDPAFSKARTARLREEIQLQRRHQLAAAFNAANFHASSGDLDKARALVTIAAAHPDLGDEVEELNRHIAEVVASRASPRP